MITWLTTGEGDRFGHWHNTMATLHIPKGVGYWGKGADTSELPTPQSLVRIAWQVQDLDRIVAYLCGGQVFQVWCGRAECRFTTCDTLLGSCDLTDGEWVWPSGLEHYLLKHAVCLPDTFVATMRSNNWQVPAVGSIPDVDQVMDAGFGAFGDLAEWIAWSKGFREPVVAGPCTSIDHRSA